MRYLLTALALLLATHLCYAQESKVYRFRVTHVLYEDPEAPKPAGNTANWTADGRTLLVVDYDQRKVKVVGPPDHTFDLGRAREESLLNGSLLSHYSYAAVDDSGARCKVWIAIFRDTPECDVLVMVEYSDISVYYRCRLLE
jgi:hypothetical protein